MNVAFQWNKRKLAYAWKQWKLDCSQRRMNMCGRWQKQIHLNGEHFHKKWWPMNECGLTNTQQLLFHCLTPNLDSYYSHHRFMPQASSIFVLFTAEFIKKCKKTMFKQRSLVSHFNSPAMDSNVSLVICEKELSRCWMKRKRSVAVLKTLKICWTIFTAQLIW